MRKKLFITFSILFIIIAITALLGFLVLKDDTSFKIAKNNMVNTILLNEIESTKTNEIVNEVIENVIVEISEENNSSPESIDNNAPITTSNEKITTPNTTKEETKSNTKISSQTSASTSNSSKASTNNSTATTSTSINKPVETKQETQQTTTTTTPKQEETTTTNARPELAYSTYTKVNTNVIPEIIRILNDEISTQEDLVAYGCKALAGNASEAKAKTNGFTYMFVKDIHKGKVAGNYTVFEQRVRNNVGGFANYNVYAEDEYTYDGQGLNPKWSQTLVWIYLTF